MSFTLSEKKFGLFGVTTTWFNTEKKLTSKAKGLLHILRQSVQIEDFDPFVCIFKNIFTTTCIDLTQTEEQLWKALSPKSCRYEVRKVKKLVDAGQDIELRDVTDRGEFLRIANRYIEEREGMRPLKFCHIEKYLKDDRGELIGIYYEGKLIGGNLYIKDPPWRVRLLHSFNDRFGDPALQDLTAPLMRYLHWEAMVKRYKPQGFRAYDMGGVWLDTESHLSGITKFKMSFGGSIVEQYDYVLVPNRWVMRAYRSYEKIKRRMR